MPKLVLTKIQCLFKDLELNYAVTVNMKVPCIPMQGTRGLQE